MSECTENLPGQINRKKSASIHIYTEEMQKLPAFLGISMSLGWKTGEVDQKIHEKYQGVEAGAYLRVCEILENLSMDSRIWSLMRCGQSLHL